MGFGQASIMLKVGFILIIVALVIQILAVALPYWYSKEVASNYDVYGGLFRGCAEAGNTKACNNVKNPTGTFILLASFNQYFLKKNLFIPMQIFFNIFIHLFFI
jgi:hypothetical protein